MKLLWAGQFDWANLCNRIARAINASTGEKTARVITERRHPFGYQEDMVVEGGNYDDLSEVAQAADWLISTGDGNYELFCELRRTLPLRKDVKLAVTHAGTAYRRNAPYYNDFDERMGVRVRFIGADSLRLGSGQVYFGTCDPVPWPLSPAPRHGGQITVTHTPTVRAQKGTAVVLPVLERLHAAGTIILDLMEKVAPDEVMRRRKLAHVHVDQMSDEVGGFGQSAIEAMGCGNVVLADIHNVGVMNLAKPPIIDVRNARELEEWLTLFARDPDVLDRNRNLSLDWSYQHSSPSQVAAYWLETLRNA